MEFVGRTLRKEFKGRGNFSGVVNSYNPSSGSFEVLYEDGNSEEVDLDEISLLLQSQLQLDEEERKPKRVGRKPKKRRRLESRCGILRGSGNGSENIVIESARDESNLGNYCDLGGNLNENGDSHDGFSSNLEMRGGVGGNLMGSVNLNETLENDEGLKDSVFANGSVNKIDNLREGLDLNAELDLNLNDGNDVRVNTEEYSNKRDCIDLNLDANGDFDENFNAGDVSQSLVETQKKGCDFDLNLDVADEFKDDGGESGGKVNGSTFDTVEEIQMTNRRCLEEKHEVHLGDSLMAKAVDHSFVGTIRNLPGPGGDVVADTSLLDLEKESSKNGGFEEVQLKDGLPEASTPIILGNAGDSGCPGSQRSSYRKRRKLSDNMTSTTETILRRSSRRVSAQNYDMVTPPAVNSTLISPEGSAITEEKPAVSVCMESEKSTTLPTMLQLPPSSQNLNLDDIPILNLFSVYACLRSFSTLLFLSPFELEDFVAALKSKSPSLLFDNVHVAILQNLRKHLESLSDEGSQSASNCLRSLNWDLLDLITWPIFMVEYFVVHSSGLKPDFDLSCLNLFKTDYYEQPAYVKVEILHCLCDELIEVESVRSELNRRSLTAESGRAFEKNLNFEICKKRTTVDHSSDICLNGETIDDTNDLNSDECCLCKMDGNLICCDGCPAAYHSKCLGLASDLLPEGNWYCPECAMNRHKPWLKVRKSLRGAELLGIDPHGRLYFHSCGYLLVSDSYDSESSIRYYHRDHLNLVIDVLKSLEFFYGDILWAIYKYWDNVRLTDMGGKNDSLYGTMSPEMPMNGQISALSNLFQLASSGPGSTKNENDEKREGEENSNVSYSDLGPDISNSLKDTMTMAGSYVTSEGSVDIKQRQTRSRNGYKPKLPAKFLDQSDIPRKVLPVVDFSVTPVAESIRPGNFLTAATTRKVDTSERQLQIGYVNYYSFGRIVFSVAEEIMHKSSDKTKENLAISEEEITLQQMKAILKKCPKFCWSNMQNLYMEAQKEKCGWCFTCKYFSDDKDCLFVTSMGPVREPSLVEMDDLRLKNDRKGHLTVVTHQVLSMENRLRGLLLGPWLNSHHTKLWCESILNASDIASVKRSLLTLESSIGRRALSAEWLKHVDSPISVGSASHILISSTSTKHVIGRKRPRCSDIESNPANSASGLGMFWWRGGRLSRKMFNWKVLPHSLVSKAARQAGCMKITGILYLENSEYAKRSKYVAWRAAVETSTSTEQLALLVRELDLNIKWDDIENMHPLPALDKESKKSIRLFKKVIVRRKCTQGEGVKYLLDFGKRRSIPNIVVKHGSLLEESSNEKKKYWLDESHVPLHLVKNFEEKRISRRSNDVKPEKSIEFKVMRRPQEKKGFAYLFSKAEKSEYSQCGLCKKDVMIREAVSCQYCKGFFHKRHVKKSARSSIAGCKHTCHQCEDGTRAKIDSKRARSNKKGGKLQPQKSKNVLVYSRVLRSKGCKKACTGGQKREPKNNEKVQPAVPLRRSPRKAKCLSLQNKKRGRPRKKKQTKSNKGANKKPKRVSCRKMRTQVCHTYWLNGLLLSRKPNDERALLFRDKYLLVPSEESSMIPNQPKCRLCQEAGYISTLNYISCELCGEWFHGDAFKLHPENINMLIGFRCHACLQRTPPVCPHLEELKTDAMQWAETLNNVATEPSEELSNAAPLNEIACN